MTETTFGEGWAVGSLDRIGSGPGFRLARVDPATVRSFRNVSGSVDAVYLCVGGTGGYVGRDGILPGGESRGRPQEARF